MITQCLFWVKRLTSNWQYTSPFFPYEPTFVRPFVTSACAMKRHGPFFRTPGKIIDIRFAAQTASSRRSLVPILHFSHAAKAPRPDVSSKCGVWRAVPIVERAIKVLLARRSRPFDIYETDFIGDGKKRSYVSREGERS
jgi:hypothetical protein